MNDNIHIYVKIDSTRWKKTTHSRSLLLSQLIRPYSENITLWDESPKKRLKMIGVMSSGELLNEMSILFLSNPSFTHFVKKVDGDKVISFKTEDSFQKQSQEVHKLVPITLDDSPESFGIKLEGEETKFFSYCNYIDENCKNPIEYDASKDEGIYIGEMGYFYKDLYPLFIRLKERFVMLLSYVRDFDNKTQDQRHLESILPKIINKLDLMLSGRNVSESLRMYLSLVKMNLNANDKSIIKDLEDQLERNNPVRYLHGIGTWYKLEDTKLSSINYNLLDYSPYRTEINGVWKYNNLDGPCTISKSKKEESNDKIYFKVCYIEKHNELISYSFYSIIQKDIIKIGIKQDNKNTVLKSFKIDKDTNRHTIESLVRQECLRYLIQCYTSTTSNKDSTYLSLCISFLLTYISSPISFIRTMDVLDSNNKIIYTSMSNDFIKSLFVKSIPTTNYYNEIITKLACDVNGENYKDTIEIINLFDSTVKKEYKDPFYGDSLLHLSIYLSSIDQQVALDWIETLLTKDNLNINVVENSKRTIFHTLLYNSMETFGNLIDDDTGNILLKLLKYENIDINHTDDNGLTLLHIVLMVKFEKMKDILEAIFEKNPDLKLKSNYPVEATPLQIALLYNQDESVIEIIKSKLTPEDFESQINKDIVSHVDDLSDASTTEKQVISKHIIVSYKKKEEEKTEVIETPEEPKDKEEEEVGSEIEKVINAKSYQDILNIIKTIPEEKINDTDSSENTIGHEILKNSFVKNNFDADKIINIFYNLWENKYNINSLDENNDSPFLLLFTMIYSDITKKEVYKVVKVFLEDFETDPDNTNEEGISALYIAVKNQDEDFVKLLLDYDSSISEEVFSVSKDIKNEKIKRMIQSV